MREKWRVNIFSGCLVGRRKYFRVHIFFVTQLCLFSLVFLSFSILFIQLVFFSSWFFFFFFFGCTSFVLFCFSASSRFFFFLICYFFIQQGHKSKFIQTIFSISLLFHLQTKHDERKLKKFCLPPLFYHLSVFYPPTFNPSNQTSPYRMHLLGVKTRGTENVGEKIGERCVWLGRKNGEGIGVAQHFSPRAHQNSISPIQGENRMEKQKLLATLDNITLAPCSIFFGIFPSFFIFYFLFFFN